MIAASPAAEPTPPVLAFVRAPERTPPPPYRDPPPDREDAARFVVTVIDNDRNTYEQVMAVVMAALGVDLETAYAIAWEVDHAGQAVVAIAPRQQAEAIAAAIRSIGIEVRVEPVTLPA